MIKTYEEVAMNVIREDWEFRKSQNNASFSQERIARMMGISRSQFAKALGGKIRIPRFNLYASMSLL